MNRKAFTLVELLVTIAIIGLILAISFPAIMSIRSSGRNIVCKSNMRQLGLANHMYHDVHGELPSTLRGGPQDRPEHGWSLLAETLSYIDQNPLSDQLNTRLPNASPENRRSLVLRSPIHVCPSDNGSYEFQAIFSGYRLKTASSNYVGCDPAIGDHTHTQFANIGDGLSNTLLLGEMLRQPDSGAPILGGLSDGSEYALNTEPTLPVIRECKPGSVLTLYGVFESNHPGGANFCFADGSIHMLTNTISDHLFEALGTLNGGEPLEAF